MTGFPVVFVDAGGFPVSEADSGWPIEEAASGLPVTLVASGGLPVAIIGEVTPGLPVPVATWVSGPEDNTPELSVEVPDGVLVEDDAYVWQFDTVNTFDGADFFEVPGTVNATDALDGDIDETITELPDDTWYARFKVTGKTEWSNIVSETIDVPVHMTSAATFDVDESDTETLVGTLTASRPSTFAIGGTDAADFEIQSGDELHFVDPPDYENPDDSGTNNTYDITITPTAIDDSEVGAAQNVTVNVQDVEDTVITLENLFDKPGGGKYKGALYDFSDLSTLFQDTGATTPITTNGQTIKRANDKSGNSNNVTDSTGVLFSDTGGLKSADATSAILKTAASVDLTDGPFLTVLIAAADNGSVGTGSYLQINNGTDTTTSPGLDIARVFGSPNPSIWAMLVGNSGEDRRVATNTLSDNSGRDPYVIRVTADFSVASPEALIALNGVATGSTTSPSNNTNTNFGSGKTLSLFNRNAGGLAIPATRVYAVLVINRELTAPELAAAETLIGAKAGVTI